ncbi:hypothetical protein ACWGS9_19940 [Bradyrhizobium sp. Arg314]
MSNVETALADELVLAANWLAETPRAQRGAAIPELRRRFGIDLDQALVVVRQNNMRLAKAT